VILTLKILKNVLLPDTTTALDIITITKGATRIGNSVTPTLSDFSTASKRMPIRKNKTLFVIKPR
jgi:hypothetical protein